MQDVDLKQGMIERLAQICHEANRAYCRTLGDISQPAWNEAPEWQKQSAHRGVEFHLSELEAGRIPTADASHKSWLAEKEKEGWSYGEVKDPYAKKHPCYVPYGQLPLSQRMKDHIFGGIILAYHMALVVEDSKEALAQIEVSE